MNFFAMTGFLRILQAMQGQGKAPLVQICRGRIYPTLKNGRHKCRPYISKRKLFIISIICTLCFCADLFAWDDSYIQVPGVIHLHTVVSGGTKTVNEYAQMAEERGIGIVIITDHDNAKYEYGIGLKKIFKKVVEEDSVLKFGIDKYLGLIKDAGERNPDVMVIDGVESFPFYYWTGSYFKKNLTLNNRDKHMLVIGLDNPEDYKYMPLIVNGIARYDQYHGENYVLPYQDLINYVNKKGGLTFWAHPEHEEVVNVKGVRAVTKPYYEDLLRTDGYTGFSVFYEGYNKIGRPGGIWDKVLMEYCSGKTLKDYIVSIIN